MFVWHAEAHSQPDSVSVPVTSRHSLLQSIDVAQLLSHAEQLQRRMQERGLECKSEGQWTVLELQSRWAWHNDQYETAYERLECAYTRVFARDAHMADKVPDLCRELYEKGLALQDKSEGEEASQQALKFLLLVSITRQTTEPASGKRIDLSPHQPDPVFIWMLFCALVCPPCPELPRSGSVFLPSQVRQVSVSHVVGRGGAARSQRCR